MKVIKSNILGLFFLFILNPHSYGQLVKGQITGIHDGDSFYGTFVTADTSKVDSSITIVLKKMWIRLVNLDCPEVISNHITANQEFGVAIGDSLRTLLKGTFVEVKFYGKDRYHRQLAQVFIDKHDLGEYILSKGWAWYVSGPLPKQEREVYKKTRDIAKADKRGIWSTGTAIKPSQFRKENWKE